jgi:hypothetical protein
MTGVLDRVATVLKMSPASLSHQTLSARFFENEDHQELSDTGFLADGPSPGSVPGTVPAVVASIPWRLRSRARRLAASESAFENARKMRACM